jgi:hypothetical protein
MIMLYGAKIPYLGLLGLSPSRGTDIENSEGEKPADSVLDTLSSERRTNYISKYWAYTAGAYYRQENYPASLTFGGYDAARGNTKDVLKAPTRVNDKRDLVVEISGISITNPVGASASPKEIQDISIEAFIDSVVPEIWLPAHICHEFEDALGLIWDDNLELYLISEAQDASLSARNIEIKFSLGAKATGSSTSIKFPYKAFYQPISSPLANITDNSTHHYFPLKKAAGISQYYLGRTFLQEA